MRFTRFVRHMLVPSWRVDRAFTPEVMAAIELAVQDSEARHRGEIRFAVEGGLDFPALLQGVDARSRAVDVFAYLRVWDTEENTGVLIYVQWLDRRVEMAFREGRYGPGAVEAVRAVGELLAGPFPARGDNPDELPNRPVRL